MCSQWSFDLGNASSYHVMSCTPCTGGRHCTAECRKLTNIMFLINSQKIGKYQCPVKTVIRQFHLSCINDQRNRTGNALVSASGVDHNRHITASHSCLRSRCSKTSHSGEHIVRIIFTNHAPDTQAVFSGHSFMGNSHVASNLGIQKFSDIRKIHCICEFPDILQIQQCAVCLFFFFLSLIRIKKDLFCF